MEIHCYFWHIFCKIKIIIYICSWKNSIAEAEKLMSRQKSKGCARHSFRDCKMKNFIITTVMALLIGVFAFTANAQDRKSKSVVKARSKTEKPIKPKSKKQDLKINVNENFVKAQNNAEQKAIKENKDLLDAFVKAVNNCEIEHNKKPIDKNKFSQYLEEALRLSTKINTKMLTDAQKDTFEKSMAKLNGFLKG